MNRLEIRMPQITLEPSCLNDLHQLRILFWQVVGSKRWKEHYRMNFI
jgi:hypothetical protein